MGPRRSLLSSFCNCSLVMVMLATSLVCAGCKDISGFSGFGKPNEPKWEDLCREATETLAKPIKPDKYNSVAKHCEELYNQSLEIADKKFGPESPQTAISLGYLAAMYKNRQDWRLAGKTYKRLIEIKDKIDPDSMETKQFKSDYEVVQEKLKEYGLDEESLAKKKDGSDTGEKKKKKKKKKKEKEE